MKFRNIWLAFKDQLPISRLIRNIRTGKIIGVFSKRSHLRAGGWPKVKYSSKDRASKAAKKMAEKTSNVFSHYKCLYCDGYHIGKSNVSKGIDPK